MGECGAEWRLLCAVSRARDPWSLELELRIEKHQRLGEKVGAYLTTTSTFR